MGDYAKPYAQRCWINQPSAMQPYHAYHGKRVIAMLGEDKSAVAVYFVGGETVGLEVSSSALSPGWPKGGKIPRDDRRRFAAWLRGELALRD